MVAEFEADLARARSREGMAVAKAKGRLRGKKPKLKANQEAHLVDLWRAGGHTTIELAELFDVARSTVYRAIERAGERAEGSASSPTPAKSRPPFAVRRLSGPRPPTTGRQGIYPTLDTPVKGGIDKVCSDGRS